jgi:hypothetical protein
MKVHVKEIIDQMSPEVLAEVEKAAKDQGVGVEQFVSNQLSVRIREEDMTVDIQKIDWDIHVDHTRDARGGSRDRIHGGLRGRF